MTESVKEGISPAQGLHFIWCAFIYLVQWRAGPGWGRNRN